MRKLYWLILHITRQQYKVWGMIELSIKEWENGFFYKHLDKDVMNKIILHQSLKSSNMLLHLLPYFFPGIIYMDSDPGFKNYFLLLWIWLRHRSRCVFYSFKSGQRQSLLLDCYLGHIHPWFTFGLLHPDKSYLLYGDLILDRNFLSFDFDLKSF